MTRLRPTAPPKTAVTFALGSEPFASTRPGDRQHPPALAVVDELDAVDAAHEGARVSLAEALVGAEDMPQFLKALKTEFRKSAFNCS